MGGKCQRCGSIDNLEFDHIDPKDKNFTIGKRLVSAPIDEIKIELEKCQLLCKLCHKEKNKVDNGEAQHGKRSMYRHHGCRCDLCREANNAYMREYKRKKRKELAGLV